MTHGHTKNNLALDTISGKWTMPVVHILQRDALRYSAIEKALPSITQRALTITLRKLKRNGIIYRNVYPAVPPQVEYGLTPLGLNLLELSGKLSDWSNQYEEDIKRAQKSYDRRNKIARPV